MDPYQSALMVVLALLLVFLNGFFVLSEFAIVKVRRSKLEELSKNGSNSAKLALKVTASLDSYLSATQLGITLSSLALGWIGEPAIAEILEVFLVESFEMIDQLDQDLIELENNPKDLDLLNRIFRVAHTIKGSSSFLGFDVLTRLTHNMEDVLNKARKGDLEITHEVMDVILESVDLMKALLEAIKDSGSDDRGIEIDNTVKKLEAVSNGEIIK